MSVPAASVRGHGLPRPSPRRIPTVSPRCSRPPTRPRRCRRAPTGRPPTCCGTSARCSCSGARSCASGYPIPTRPTRRSRLALTTTTSCSSSTDRPAPTLVDALEATSPTTAVWTWFDADQSAGFVRRRQAHEALIHRLDAELTAGDVSAIDPALATDGVAEVFDWMYSGIPAWAQHERSGPLGRVTTTDTGAEWFVQLGSLSGTSPNTGNDLHRRGDDRARRPGRRDVHGQRHRSRPRRVAVEPSDAGRHPPRRRLRTIRRDHSLRRAVAAACAAAGSASAMRSIAASSIAAFTNHASKALGGRYTPASSIEWKNGV